MFFRNTMIVLFAAGLFALLALAWRWLFDRSSVQRRWEQMIRRFGDSEGEISAAGTSFEKKSWLGRWLYRAGFRRVNAASTFVLATVACLVLGLTVALSFRWFGLQAFMEQTVVLVPGGIGESVLPIVWAAPWILLVIVACVPWLIVRRARRLRVECVEQDLPLALELLSTLSEAGLGFDAGLTRILKTRLAGRPLAIEMQMFQADLLAGQSRVESLRRLSSRSNCRRYPYSYPHWCKPSNSGWALRGCFANKPTTCGRVAASGRLRLPMLCPSNASFRW